MTSEFYNEIDAIVKDKTSDLLDVIETKVEAILENAAFAEENVVNDCKIILSVEEEKKEVAEETMVDSNIGSSYNLIEVKNELYIPKYRFDRFDEESKLTLIEFVCCLCNGVYSQPVIDDCFHVFCNECVNLYITNLKDNNQIIVCPLSNEETTCYLSNLKQMPFIQNIIDKKDIRCSNDNCNWKGKVCLLEKHINDECLQQLIKCANDQCTYICPRYQMVNHNDICDFRNSICINCNQNVIFNQISHHQSICPKMIVPCSKCTDEFEREAQDNHIINVCRETVISCPLILFGCDSQFKRDYLNNHLSTETIKHNNLLQEIISKCKLQENEKIELRANEIAEERIQLLMNTIKSLANERDELKESSRSRQVSSTVINTESIEQKINFLNHKRYNHLSPHENLIENENNVATSHGFMIETIVISNEDEDDSRFQCDYLKNIFGESKSNLLPFLFEDKVIRYKSKENIRNILTFNDIYTNKSFELSVRMLFSNKLIIGVGVKNILRKNKYIYDENSHESGLFAFTSHGRFINDRCNKPYDKFLFKHIFSAPKDILHIKFDRALNELCFKLNSGQVRKITTNISDDEDSIPCIVFYENKQDCEIVKFFEN